MKFNTWAASQRMLHACAPGSQTSSDSEPQQHGLTVAVPQRLVQSCSVAVRVWYLPSILAVKCCAKSYILCITGGPFGVFSCVINFHFKAMRHMKWCQAMGKWSGHTHMGTKKVNKFILYSRKRKSSPHKRWASLHANKPLLMLQLLQYEIRTSKCTYTPLLSSFTHLLIQK